MLQSVSLGAKANQTQVCDLLYSQSSCDAETPKANTALQFVFLGTKSKQTVVCSQRS